jgi:hypothetical protein
MINGVLPTVLDFCTDVNKDLWIVLGLVIVGELLVDLSPIFHPFFVAQVFARRACFGHASALRSFDAILRRDQVTLLWFPYHLHALVFSLESRCVREAACT